MGRYGTVLALVPAGAVVVAVAWQAVNTKS